MKKHVFALAVSLLVALFTPLISHASTITVDGSTSDWAGITALGTDADDVSDDSLDVKASYATNDSDNLYLRLDLYGNLNRVGHRYFIYLDTDKTASTGFTYGWWTTGADYRVYIDEWNIGLQKFMGSSSTDDTWGWGGVIYSLKTIPIVYSQNILECSIPRADIGEASFPEANNVLFRAWPGDDSTPYYNASPLAYAYKIDITPFPQQLALKGFNLTIDSSWDIRANTSDTEDMFCAQQLQQELTNKYGLSLTINSTSSISGTKHIILTNPVEDTLMQSLLIQRNLYPETTLNEEGYLLEVYSDNMIIASSNTSKGLFYGMQTIRQILAKTDTSTIAYGLKIKDWPDSRMRGMHFCGVNFDSSSVDYVYDKIDKMAKYKMNMAVFSTEWWYYLDYSDNRTKLHDLFSYCKQRHIEPIPEVQSGAAIFGVDVDCAEGFWAQDEQFKFVNNVAEPVKPVSLALENPGFETDANGNNIPDGWTFDASYGRSDWSWDSTTYHSGTHSVKVSVAGLNNVKTNLLVSEIMNADPNTVYSLSFWAKTQGIGGKYKPAIRAAELDSNGSWIRQHTAEVSSSNWTKGTLDFVTASNCAKIYIYANIWDGYGTAWFDDVSLRRINSALKNVIRTESSDIVVTSLDKTKTYVEGVDYNVIDGQTIYPFNTDRTAFRIERIPTGQIADLETVLVNYDFAVGVVFGAPWSHPYCISEPRTYDIMYGVFTDIINDSIFAPKYISIGHDEIRGINRDSRCRKRGLTNAELLAEDLNKLNDCIHSINPSVRMMMWDDMLNPWHNGSNWNPYYQPGGKDYQVQYGGPPGDTYLAADLISKDIIQLIWAYGTDPLGIEIMDNSPEYFKSKGFDYFVCTGYDLGNIKYCKDILKERKDGLGVLDTAWPDWSASVRWAGLTPSADYAWLYSRPVAEFHLNENTGSLAYDSSPNNNTGTITGATWTEGFLGSALSFDGNDYVTVAGSEVLNPATALTLEAWVKLPSYQSYPIDIITKYNAGIAGSYLLSILPDGKAYFSIECPWSSITSTNSVSLNVWHHIAITFDGTTKSIYIDGSLNSQNTGGGLSSHSTPVLIGARYYYGSPANCFIGSIDEARIYDRALTDSEILEKYNELLAEKNKTLVAEYRLDENTGTTAYDSTPNNNDGAITDAAWTTGISNSALSFDGVDDYVRVSDASSLDVTDKLTISTWVYITSWANSDSYARIVSKFTGGTPGSGYILCRETTTQTLMFQLRTAQGTVMRWTPSLQENRWYHIAAVFDGSSMKLYVNGSENGTWGDSTFSQRQILTNNLNLYVGGEGSSYNLKGAIDEVKIYNRSLTAQEVSDEYNSHPVNSITIDGSFSDWNSIPALGTDPSGDASGGIVDWTSLWATNNAGNLYLSYSTVSNIDFATNAWRYAVYLDTDNNPATGYKGMDGSFQIGAEYLIEGGSLHQYTGNGTSWSWSWISSLSYSFAATRLEMAVPEASLGLGTNYTIKIMLLGNNPTTADYAYDNKSGYTYTK